MNAVLKFAFNALRNISLVLVILFLAYAWYLQKNPEEARRILNMDPAMAYGKTIDDEGVVSDNSIEIRETDNIARKRPITVKAGTAYLRPSQVMYVYDDTLVTTNLNKIAISSPLTKILSELKLKEDDHFFKRGNAIINCQYVQQIISRNEKNQRVSYNYKYYAVMEDGMEVRLSKEVSSELKSHLNKIFF